MNSAIQIKLFSSADPDLYWGGRYMGGRGWYQKKLFFFLWPLGPQFGLTIKKAPPLNPPLFSKAPILQGMNDEAGI